MKRQIWNKVWMDGILQGTFSGNYMSEIIHNLVCQVIVQKVGKVHFENGRLERYIYVSEKTNAA